MPPRLTPPAAIPASLEPLKASAEYDELEAELKAAFAEVFEAMLRPGLQRVNSYGVPHRGTFPTVERFVKADGLAMERKTAAEAFMAELYRAWRARNPRRGTAFLRYYLQLLWPGQWSLVQQWQDGALPYPTSLHDGPAPGRFLTSRLRLSLALEDDDSGVLVSKLSGSFRAVLPARMLLDVALTAPLAAQSLRAGNWCDDCEWEDFEGVAAPDLAAMTTLTLTAPSPATGDIGAAAGGGSVSNSGSVAANFTLSANLGASVSPAAGSVPAGGSVAYTITPVAAGAHTITLANASGGSVAGSPAAFTAVDPFPYANVVLRLLLDGANNSTAFPDLSPNTKVVTAAGNAKITTAQGKWNGSSLALDGDADWLEVASKLEDFRFGTGDFFLGAWVRSTSTLGFTAVFDFYGSAAAGSWQLGFTADGRLAWYANDGGAAVLVAQASTGAVNTGNWTFVAASRASGVLRLFAGGSKVAEVTDTRNYNSTVVTRLAIGAQVHTRNAAYDLAGEVDDVTIIKGAAWVTGDFAVPTGPLPYQEPTVDADWNSVILRVTADTGLQDLSRHRAPVSLPVGGVTISTTGQKWGLGCADFNSASSLRYAAHAEMAFGTGDFDIALWVKPTDLSSAPYLVTYRDGVRQGWYLSSNSSGELIWGQSGPVSSAFNHGGPLILGQWNYVQVRRVSGQRFVRLNGAQLGASGTLDTTNYEASTNWIALGADFNNTNRLLGQIDDVRISKVQRPTPVPTAAFPVAANDVDSNFGNISLLLPLNAPNGSTTILDFSGSPKTVTAHGTAQSSTAQSKFNGASLRFDGGGRASIPDHASLRYATGNFTHKLWLRLDNNTQTAIVLNKADGTGFYPWQLFVNAGKLMVRGFTSGEVLYSIETAAAVPANQWLHVAVVRVDNTVTLYVDGVSQGSATLAGPALFENAGAVQIGAYGTGAFGLLGYVDDLCMRAGAEFTANFTPPSTPQATG